jgi:hypothetical protein
MFHDPDLREPAGEGRWSLDVGRERLDTCGQGRVAGLGLDARPAARRIASDGGFEIVAKRGGKRALIARRGLDLMERAIARAAAFDCPEQRLCFRFESAERRACRGDLAFGTVARRCGAGTIGLGLRQRRARGREPRFGDLAPGARGPARFDQRRLVAKFGHLRLQPGGFRRRRAGVCSGQFQRVRGDARFGQFGGLHGARAAERRLRLARRVLQLDGAGVDRRARRFGLGQTQCDRIPLRLEPGERGLRILAERRFAAAVGEEGGALVGQIANAPRDPRRARR